MLKGLEGRLESGDLSVEGPLGALLEFSRQGDKHLFSDIAFQIALATLNALNKIVDVLISVPDEDMYARVLKILREMTRSELGFFGFIDRDGNLVIPSMTDFVWEQCQMADKDIMFPPDKWGDSIWGRAITTKQILKSNRPRKVPQGHLSIQNVVCLPLVYNNQTEGLITLANKDNGYSQTDIKLLSVIIHYLAPYFHSWRRAQEEEEARRKIETRIKEQLEFTQNLMDAIPSPLFYKDINGRYLGCNNAFLDFFQISRSDLIGKTAFDIAPREVAEVYHAKDCELFESGSWQVYDWDAVNAQGETRDVTYYKAPFYDPDDNIQGLIGVMIDITDRKQAELERAESEEKYRSLFENVMNGFALHEIVLNEEGKPIDYIFLEVNGAFEQTTNLKRSDIIGKKVTEVLPGIDKDPADWIDRYGQVAITGQNIRFEDYSEAMEKWFSILVFSPRKGRFATIFEDITDRKKTEIALKNSEQRFRSVINNIGIGITVINQNMEILDMNNKMKEWFPDIDLSKKNKCYETFRKPPGEDICDYCPSVKTFEDSKVHESNALISGTHGERYYRVLSSPLKNNGGEIASAIVLNEDITDRQRVEEERNKLEKLESIGILAGGIAHDFNNLLTVIQGNVALARMDIDPDDEINERLEQAEIATERARSLTHQLLTFSRGGKPIKAIVQPAPIIKEAAVFGLSGSTTDVKFYFEEDLPNVEIDAGQITQVIQNLVINAIQAMPEGSLLKIEGRNRKIVENNDNGLSPNRYLEIKVIDQGHGISPKNIGKIFDPYFTTKEFGNGLGLSTTYSIIKNHGGKIEVESEEGVGSTFTIYLPASKETITIRPNFVCTPPKGKGKILVLDDLEFIRDLANKILTQGGYEVDCVNDGQEALDQYKKQSKSGQPYDAIVLDLTIKGGPSGNYAIEKIREFDPHVTAIASSGYSNNPVLASYRDYGFSGIIVKPYKPTELYQVLNEVLQAKKAMALNNLCVEP